MDIAWRAMPVVIAALILFLVGSFAAIDGIRYQAPINRNRVFPLVEGWSDENGENVSLPMFVPNMPKRYSYSLVLKEYPDVREPVLFFAENYLNAYFFLDGEPLGECLAKPAGESESRGKVLKAFPLPEDYAGKKLSVSIELILASSVGNEIPAPLIGEHDGILLRILERELPGLLVDFAIICFSVVLLLFGMKPKEIRKDNSFIYIGLFIGGFAIYSFCVTDSIHIFMSNSYFIYLMEFVLLAVLPIPLVASIMEQCSQEYQKILRFNQILLLLNLILQILVHFFTSLEMRGTVAITHGVLIFTAEAVLFSILKGCSRKKRNWIILPYLPVFIGGFLDICLFYLSRARRVSFGVQLGVLFFVLVQIYYLMQSYFSQYANNLKTGVYRHMAYTDALTGLKNRAAFERKIEEIEHDLSRYEAVWCVVADVNGLKFVNDTMGHAWGDKLISGAAQVLHSVMCESCDLYRTGGDEFVMFVYNQPEEALKQGYIRFNAAAADYNKTHEFCLSVAIGYDQLRFDGKDTIQELITRADSLMYLDKQRQNAVRGH